MKNDLVKSTAGKCGAILYYFIYIIIYELIMIQHEQPADAK